MRKLFLILFFFTGTTLVLSQTYFPFPVANAKWCGFRTFQYFNGANDQRHTYDYQEFINGDSIINGLTYHKIFENGTFSCIYLFQPGSCGSYNYMNEYKGSYREDSLHKIYFVAKDSLNEMLLYDFSLSLYDTLPYSFNQTLYANGTPLFITRIDSVFDGFNYRKRYNISRDTTLAWEVNYVSIIEGIGSTHGLLWDINPYFETDGSLYSHSQNGIALYPDSSVDCIISGLSNTSPLPYWEIYPNPANEELTINCTPLAIYDCIRIFDTAGKEILFSPINKATHKIKITDLRTGIYFVEIKSNKGVYRKKFVKQ